MTTDPMNALSGCCPAADPKDQLCSVISRTAQEDPIGSAPPHRRYLLIEVPLPWSFRVEESPHFPPGLEKTLKQKTAEGFRHRLLAFTSEFHPSPAGYRRLMEYRLPGGACSSFAKREFIVREELVQAFAAALLADHEPLGEQPEVQEFFHASRDLFVCTHDSHDACCGRFGFPLYREIGEKHAPRSEGTLRVWQTSHIGGHRHAPTLIDFPQGRYWAQVNPDMLDTLLWHNGSFASISGHYRGWGGISRHEQVLERELFARYDWNWVDFWKRSREMASNGVSVATGMEYGDRDGKIAGFAQAEIYEREAVPTGGCGHPAGEAKQLGAKNFHCAEN